MYGKSSLHRFRYSNYGTAVGIIREYVYPRPDGIFPKARLWLASVLLGLIWFDALYTTSLFKIDGKEFEQYVDIFHAKAGVLCEKA